MDRYLKITDETDPSKQLAMADPESPELMAAFNRMGQNIADGFTVHSDVKLVMAMASSYVMLTSPEISEEDAVQRLRDTFAARRAKKCDD